LSESACGPKKVKPLIIKSYLNPPLWIEYRLLNVSLTVFEAVIQIKSMQIIFENQKKENTEMKDIFLQNPHCFEMEFKAC